MFKSWRKLRLKAERPTTMEEVGVMVHIVEWTLMHLFDMALAIELAPKAALSQELYDKVHAIRNHLEAAINELHEEETT